MFSGFDAAYERRARIRSFQQPGLFAGVMLAGESTSIQVEDTGDMHIPVGRAVLISFSKPTCCANEFAAGDFCAGVGVSLNFAELDRGQGHASDAAIAFLRDRFNGNADLEILPYSRSLNAAADRALRIAPDAAFRATELEALFLSFMALICRLAEQAGAASSCAALSAREQRRVQLVTEHLRANLETTPSLNELSRLAGVNPTTLADNFKAAHGQTIFAYYRDLRLEAARAILRCENASVMETGFRVGFSSPTAFSTAYRRRFGHAPSREAAAPA